MRDEDVEGTRGRRGRKEKEYHCAIDVGWFPSSVPFLALTGWIPILCFLGDGCDACSNPFSLLSAPLDRHPISTLRWLPFPEAAYHTQ